MLFNVKNQILIWPVTYRTFTDIAALSRREQNYIGLAYGLVSMRGDGIRKFRPDDPVT
ncbi:MAG: hypothetical protein IMW96_10440 [Thermoanaerobacteraceae bacterium]|nr:hypothetical protein [Thermoanaerobacteraceae bacterium]